MINKLLITVLAVASLTVSTSSFALDHKEIDLLRDKAVKIVSEKGLESAIKILGDKANGFLDLNGNGLHTWAINNAGMIVFDHSGQTEAGMDLSTLTTNDGQFLHTKTINAAETSGHYDEDSWPHPTTGADGKSYVSCAIVRESDKTALCTMAWY